MLRTADFERHKVCATPLFPEENRRTLRATGCQGGRADRRPPLLIQEGYGAFAPGGGYEIQEGSAASRRGGYRTLTPNSSPSSQWKAAEAIMSVNRKYGVPVCHGVEALRKQRSPEG